MSRFPVPRKLPPGFDMHDYYWMPTREEHILARLREMKAEWDAQELAYYRRKANEIGIDVAADRAWLAAEAEREERKAAMGAELTAIQTYFRSERETELAKDDQARREKAKLILRDLNADINRFERATLDRRGLIRGRRSS